MQHFTEASWVNSSPLAGVMAHLSPLSRSGTLCNTAHTSKEKWLQDSEVDESPGVAQPEPRLSVNQHLWRQLKVGVHQRSPPGPMEPDRCCTEERRGTKLP